MYNTVYTQVDTIDPVAGVTVLEGGRTRQGPKVIEVSINTTACTECYVVHIYSRELRLKFVYGKYWVQENP